MKTYHASTTVGNLNRSHVARGTGAVFFERTVGDGGFTDEEAIVGGGDGFETVDNIVRTVLHRASARFVRDMKSLIEGKSMWLKQGRSVLSIGRQRMRLTELMRPSEQR